ncbi:hypothetical protein RHMOL_Rhmol10G0131500 [Rhododendron molle]|uniref:Uncharacterized protein n=1 Tax=Rhododendron molle TaxID=49168 RepID=A0ACC0M3G4_RHOML|nr:hypothetical protein RHMOL_Rhmol10G0131500 [Rhododendron molle]
MARNLIIEEPVPSVEQWRRAPYLQTIRDLLWGLAKAYPAERAPLANPTFFTSPVHLRQAELINPSSVLRLRIERRDFPHSECHFGAQSSPPTDWPEWVDEVVSDSGRKQLLIDVVMLSRNLNILRHGVALKNLEHAFSRSSIDTHSFAWAWGESGLSLEDVVILTCLSLHRLGVVVMGQCLLPVRASILSSVASGGDSVARAVVNATLIAIPGWLLCLYNEASRVTIYLPDRFAW